MTPSETMQARRQGMTFSKYFKGKMKQTHYVNQEVLDQQKHPLKMKMKQRYSHPNKSWIDSPDLRRNVKAYSRGER